MSDEPIKPILPRRPGTVASPRPVEKRKPEKLKPLKKKDRRSPEQVETDCLALTTIEQACAIICIEKDKEAAAIELKMSLAEVNEIMDSAPVRLYLQKFQDKTITELAKTKVRVMRKVGICKANIEKRLMELMMMDPAETKGTVDGQVKAATLLLEKCGYGKEVDPLDGKTPEELQALVNKRAKFQGAPSVN
jgi:hypothetical protein